jgi:hypothetical protein
MNTMASAAVIRNVDPFGNVPHGADDRTAAANLRADGVSDRLPVAIGYA